MNNKWVSLTSMYLLKFIWFVHPFEIFLLFFKTIVYSPPIGIHDLLSSNLIVQAHIIGI